MSRAFARCLAFALFALLPAVPLHAQPPGAPTPPPPAAGAVRDTTRFLPPWLRGWIEFGGGWMSGPDYLKKHYESGQAFAAGLEARPNRHWALRTAVDYQMLLAQNKSDLYYTYYLPYDPSVVVTDTIHFQTQTTGWIAGLRTEVGARLPGDFWLTAGGGGGYMHSGLSGLESTTLSGLDYTARVLGSGAVSNGWGWLWTAALRYDFQPAPRVPLGIDLRTQALHRGDDLVRTWSVRACFRMPEDLPPGTQPPGRR